MSLIELVQQDLNLIFADWGELVVYRVATESLNVSEFSIDRAYTDTEIQGLIGKSESKTDRKTRRQMLNEKMEVLVRQDDLPEDAPQLTDRFLVAGEEYQIVDFQLESKTGLVTLKGVRR